ncbi:hypothetical protein LINGRAHAP2_LOCUS23194, partial [Linum grandiflorum]
PVHIFSGASKSSGTLGERFHTCTTASSASPQKECGNFECESKHLTLSIKVLFILSANPFNCGVLGGIN